MTTSGKGLRPGEHRVRSLRTGWLHDSGASDGSVCPDHLGCPESDVGRE